jgi:kynurenine formamidase
MRVLDLTLPLDAHTPAYRDLDGYQDPVYLAEPWATVAQHGYGVHRLQIDQVPPSALVGPAVVIDVRPLARVTASVLQPYADLVLEGGRPFFLAPGDGVPLSVDAVASVADWRPLLILYAGQFIDEGERYHHNRAWLDADIPLVTDLDGQAAAQVRTGDLLVVAPLPLVGLDGSPCRVFALQG